ncbi:hypothetical protein EXU85_10075 [Spirosoma sp. KCTC 42546]|uniref:hypothetical protein n=1 Tax=Spirosoma sp. KCTC 42546 TaxID=2520506 RepID=UPI001157228E|nr:hypothetical protein [Spirosoma sp. KCTC 42546]QDK78933.1 hypothetical protein EXU85_10075 [Spirosoma sp. KCTC 42546]
MNIAKWFFYLVVGYLSCSQSSTTPEPEVTIDGPYRVTATLNDSTWYGAADASKTIGLTGETSCTKNRIDVKFSTDLPFSNTTPKQAATGCVGNCVPTQILVFHNIPLAVGKYLVSDLNACAGAAGGVSYFLLLGGDSIIKTYTSQATSIGWIQITGYSASQQAVQGTFEIELTDTTAPTVRFKNGSFKALLN